MPTIMPTDRNLREAIAWIEERRGEGGDVCALMAEAGPRYNLSPLEEQGLSRFYEREDAHP